MSTPPDQTTINSQCRMIAEQLLDAIDRGEIEGIGLVTFSPNGDTYLSVGNMPRARMTSVILDLLCDVKKFGGFHGATDPAPWRKERAFKFGADR